MILRFEVDQAEAFRQGINVPKSTNHLDVDPSTLSQEERNLIADRLRGIDVLKIEARRAPAGKMNPDPDYTERIVAKLPSFESLMEAIREDERRTGIGEQARSQLRKLSSLIGVPIPPTTVDNIRLTSEQRTAVETFVTQIQDADDNVISIAAQTNPRGAEAFLRLAVAGESAFAKEHRFAGGEFPEVGHGVEFLVLIVQTYLRELRARPLER